MNDERIAVLSALMESLPGTVVFALDREYRYTIFNELHRREMAKAWKAAIKVGDRMLDFITESGTRATAKASFDRALSGESFAEIRNRRETDIGYECSWGPVRDDAGGVIGVLAIVARGLLEESQDIAHLGGWEYDIPRARITWTPEVYRIYGVGSDYDPSDVKRDIGYYAPASAPVIAEAFRRAVEEGKGYDLELELIRSDGSRIWVRTMAFAEKEDGKVVRVSGNIMDITERKTAQLELAAMNAKLEQLVLERTNSLEATNRDLETFARTMTHDLKAPLRAIAGFSRMVAEDYGSIVNGEGKRRLGIVYDNAVKLDALISDLRSLSRIGRHELDRTRIAMAAMVRAMYYETASPDDLASIEFVIGDLPDANGDSALMRKVWGNLLSNAIKFTAQKAVRTIRVSAEKTDAEIKYTVRDNGIGFDPSNVGRLFGLFSRLHAEGEYSGTGAGLAIVKRIIELHKGRVGAEGAKGEGAAFWFSLPSEDTTMGGE